MVLLWDEDVWVSRASSRAGRTQRKKARMHPLHGVSSIYSPASILSQFGQHFQAWQDRYRGKKWADLRRMNSHFFPFQKCSGLSVKSSSAAHGQVENIIFLLTETASELKLAQQFPTELRHRPVSMVWALNWKSSTWVRHYRAMTQNFRWLLSPELQNTFHLWCIQSKYVSEPVSVGSSGSLQACQFVQSRHVFEPQVLRVVVTSGWWWTVWMSEVRRDCVHPRADAVKSMCSLVYFFSFFRFVHISNH